MGKIYTALGLMSGTSMDGVDASIVQSDGDSEYLTILDQYFAYGDELRNKLTNIRDKILEPDDLGKYQCELNSIEREITLFHSIVVNKIIKVSEIKPELLGLHGQTIFHNPEKKITKQLGDGELLSQLTNKKVLYDFRQNDLKNGGQGAPLTPIFHNLLSKIIKNNHQLEYPIYFINIGGITNITNVIKEEGEIENKLEAFDIGPGNCLIDNWIRKNSKKNFDENGSIAESGKINKLILNQAIENFKINSYHKSMDIKDFDISFVRGLSLEDGCATITSFTAYLIAEGIIYLSKNNKKKIRYLICGGGRKNSYLISLIKNYISNKNNIILEPIENYGLDGDYIESQAFGYLAIRSFLNLPISFPSTTRCKFPTVGGKLIENF
tara:strand:+ start:323 stop:1468 length:1146 start_codon:yes stop_codon:yes gene_type:complete